MVSLNSRIGTYPTDKSAIPTQRDPNPVKFISPHNASSKGTKDSRQQRSTLPSTNTNTQSFSYRNLNVYVVGDVGHPKAQIIRVVHISDTRGAEEAYQDNLPAGHILIHSGDFVPNPPHRSLSSSQASRSSRMKFIKKNRQESWCLQIAELNEFFARQPHPYKIFVPGCWEDWPTCSTSSKPHAREIQRLLTSAIYLEDAWCRLFGLKIYGAPWTSYDELRPEDGASKLLRAFRASVQRSLNASRRFLRPPGSKSVCNGSSSSDASSTSYSAFSPTHKTHVNSTRHSGSTRHGFVLPTVYDVADHWRLIPEDTDIVVTHMPAWREELFSEIADRVKPALHLCGHDFTGYGVMWRRGTLFCNAALQLSTSFPYTGIPIRRRKSRLKSATGLDEKSGHSKTVAFSIPLEEESDTAASTPSPVQPSENPPSFREPQLFTPKTHGRRRPPRWQRRLPACLFRLLSGSGFFSWLRRPRVPPSSALVTVTESTRACFAHSAGDNDLIYDPDMRAGTGAIAVGGCDEYSSRARGCNGGSDVLWGGGRSNFSGVVSGTVCSSTCRRSALVIDVYVVIDDPTVILPSYDDTE